MIWCTCTDMPYYIASQCNRSSMCHDIHKTYYIHGNIVIVSLTIIFLLEAIRNIGKFINGTSGSE